MTFCLLYFSQATSNQKDEIVNHCVHFLPPATIFLTTESSTINRFLLMFPLLYRPHRLEPLNVQASPVDRTQTIRIWGVITLPLGVPLLVHLLTGRRCFQSWPFVFYRSKKTGPIWLILVGLQIETACHTTRCNQGCRMPQISPTAELLW